MRTARMLTAILALVATAAWPTGTVGGRPVIVLDGEVAQLVVDLGGGSIADFHLKDHGLNPLQWDSWSFSETPDEPPPLVPRSMGHFLCLDRWGPASEAETAHGMGWHGEATRVEWEVVQDAREENGHLRAEMAAALPMAGLSVKRTIRMADDRAFFTVREAVTNYRKLGRIYNMVQHPTIGPPFLDETTVVDANAGTGFMQASPLPDPEEPSVEWPQALTADGRTVDIRHLTDDAEPAVVSYIIDAELGWTTASSPAQGLLIGYLWKTVDYPWFDAWRHVADGRPFARGLEFGTSGLHQPFPILVEKGRIFGRQIFAHIDAGQTVTRSYACFLLEIPADYQGVERIIHADGRLVLRERGDRKRELTMEVGQLFAE